MKIFLSKVTLSLRHLWKTIFRGKLRGGSNQMPIHIPKNFTSRPKVFPVLSDNWTNGG